MKTWFQDIDRRLLTILAIVFAQIAGAALILPILPLYAERRFDLSPGIITPLVSSYFAAQFIAGPWIGRLSDRYGRIPVLIISQLGSAVSFIMLGMAQNVGMLFAARILDGITGGNIIVAQAYVTDVTTQEKRTEALGYVFAAFGLGFIFGPALGGVLSAAYGEQFPFFVAAGAAFLTVIMTWRILDESLTPERRLHNRQTRKASLNPILILRNPSLMWILVIAFVGQLALGFLQSTFALYGDAVLFAGYSERLINLGIGLLLAGVGLTQFLTQTLLLRQMLARFGEARLVILGNASRGVGLALFALIPTPLGAAIAAIFFALGQGLAMPPLQSLSTRTVGPEIRGGVLGIYQSSISLATIISTAIAGTIFAFDTNLPYWIGSLLSAVVILPAIILYQQIQAGRFTQQAQSSGD